MWLGVWNGEWFGSLEPAPPGSLSGTAALHLSASGTVEAAAGPRWITGASYLVLSASGRITDGNSLPEVVGGDKVTGGSGPWANGQGYIWKDHAWVKATKVARSGVSAHWIGKATSRVVVVGMGKTLRTRRSDGSAATQSTPSTCAKVTHLTLPAAQRPDSNSFSLSHTHTSIVSTYNGACETLSLDEIVALMGMAA